MLKLITIALIIQLSFQDSLTPRYLGTFETENPAFFATDVNNDLSSNKSDIIISSFSGYPWTSGKIWILRDFGN